MPTKKRVGVFRCAMTYSQIKAIANAINSDLKASTQINLISQKPYCV